MSVWAKSVMECVSVSVRLLWLLEHLRCQKIIWSFQFQIDKFWNFMPMNNLDSSLNISFSWPDNWQLLFTIAPHQTCDLTTVAQSKNFSQFRLKCGRRHFPTTFQQDFEIALYVTLKGSVQKKPISKFELVKVRSELNLWMIWRSSLQIKSQSTKRKG